MKNHVNAKEWIALFVEVGLDEAKREQWHELFERRHPAGHQSFLEWMGFQGGLLKFDIQAKDFSPLAGFDVNWVSGIALSGKTFYGTTSVGSIARGGTVFKINANGTGFKVLHNFVATRLRRE